jgi:hypothetical protein
MTHDRRPRFPRGFPTWQSASSGGHGTPRGRRRIAGMHSFPFLMILVATGASCSGGSSGDAQPAVTPFASCGTIPATGSIPDEDNAILQSRCQTCHTDPPQNGAPFPLITYAQVHSLIAGITPTYEEMYDLIQPNGDPHMPYGDAPQLSSGQLTTLSDWLAACAPPGE